MGRRRIYGSLLGAVLTVVAWQLFGVTAFAPRLLLAMVGFGIGHGVVRLVGGAPPESPATRAPVTAKTGKAFYAFVGIVVTITVTVFVLHQLEVRRAEQAARDARERTESLRAGIAGSFTAMASALPSTTTAATPQFEDFAGTLAAIAADPAAHAKDTPLVLDDGQRSATVTVAGCDMAMITWNPKNKDAWGFTARCPELEPKDLAPPSGVDAIDTTYLVVKTGPLAGALVDRNLLDPTIWTIATVARRMTYDASMFVFCAEGRVPGRAFLSPSNFHDRCTTLIEKKLGRTYCTYDPPEGESGFDCSRTWKTRASCGKEIFDDNKVSASFTCTYDAKTATLALKP